jgi:hypothetical protein
LHDFLEELFIVKSKFLKFVHQQTLFKPGDALVYGLVIVIMAAGFLNISILTGNGRDRLAIVEMDARVIHTVRLEQNMKTQEIRIDAGEGRYNTIFIGYDYVEVIESNCPDQVCVGWGRIRYAGQTIVCLPFRIVIRITGRIGEDAVDDITW